MINFSELLWKRRAPGERRSRLGADRATEVIEEAAAELDQVPIEDADVPQTTRIAMLSDPRGPGADRFRYLRMQLRELKSVANMRSVLITSPLPRDGKSTVAMNLATVMAEQGARRVLLIEADLYRPSLAKSLNVPSHAGLADCLERDLDPLTVIQRLEPLGWYLLQAGNPHGNPTELLQSDALPPLMQRLSSFFDWVIVDSPPIAPLADAAILSRQVDASLLVVRASRTPQDAVKKALSILGEKHVLGIILNSASVLNHLYSKYYGYPSK